MKRLLLPLFALAFLAGACSSPQSAQQTRPARAKAAGTVDTRWGNLPRYKSDQGTAVLTFDPAGTPTPVPVSFYVEIDLLVDRDGTVRDAAVRESSGMPLIDDAVTERFKRSRSRMVLAATDPAPYVLQCALTSNPNRRAPSTKSEIPIFNLNDYRPLDMRPMGQGQPTPRERGY